MLKDNPATAALPVVMFTGKQDADYAETIHRQGAVGILPKPFTEEALFSIMQTLDAVASGQAALAAGETAAGARAAPQHLDRAVQEHIERLVGEKFAALQIPNDEHIEEIAERMLLPVIEEAMQEVRERIERDFGARLQQLLNVYEEKFSGRLGELQQSLSRELDELRLATGQQHRAVIEIEPVAEVGATSGYFMMDSIVAENTHSTWSDASEQPLTENDAPQLLQVGRGAMPAGEKRRYTLVGLAAAVILAVFGLIYLYRSLLT
jgi:FixJ family two-component response regulator